MVSKLKVLVACEESQTVTKAFRRRGHEAFSCDLIECSGGHPEWHIQEDATSLLNKNWDIIIAHPPCTYLANSGVCWLKDNPERKAKMIEAAKFFRQFLSSSCPRVAVENPIMHKYAKQLIGRGQDQVIQPWMFGHKEKKATCLWLKGLPKLVPTTNLREETNRLPKKMQQRLHYLPPSPERAKLRSKTYYGIAEAMALQWGEYKR